MSWNPSRLLGLRLNLFLGDTLAAPAPSLLAEALQDVQVELGDEGNDGFQLTFGAGRKLGVPTTDSAVFSHPLLTPFSRVIVQVTLGAQVEPLIDGFITHRQAAPGNEPGSASLTVIGEDVRVMMDLTEQTVSHTGLSVDMRVQRILASYQQYLLQPPRVMPPRANRTPSPLESMPVQCGTDLAYLRRLAHDQAYVFYVEPGLVPNSNIAYWGPPQRIGAPQPALSVNMGPDTNARVQFSYDALKNETVAGMAMDKLTRALQSISAQAGIDNPLALQAARAYQRGRGRALLARENIGAAVMDVISAESAAALRTEDTLVATAEINVGEYGRVLRPRRLVGLRGAGLQLDGFYYVKRVTHAIRRGTYTQRCTLTREGVGATSMAVAV
jgi:hypothetical protein